ncbi:MAG: tetratricopeptide repeat protein [Acidobacteriota bacterium]
MGLTLLRTKGKIDEALAQFSIALKLQPDLVEAHYNLGVIFQNQGKFNRAARHFQEVLKAPDSPFHAETHYRLGLLLDEEGHRAEAVHHYRRALEIAMAANDAQLAAMIRTRLHR